MYLGNISNRVAPIICFHTDLIFSDEKLDKNFLEKTKSFFLGESDKEKYMGRKIDRLAYTIINNIWDNYEYGIYLATDKPYGKDLEDLFSEIQLNYTRLISYESFALLTFTIRDSYYLYVDKNVDRLGICSSAKAITLDKINSFLISNRKLRNS
jgi:hypothetical protein